MSSEVARFGDLFNEPQRNGLTRPKKVRGSGLPMVNMGELFAYPRIRNISMDLVPIETKEHHYLLEAGDLLFARQSLVLSGAGQCSIFLGNDAPTVFESHLIRCRLNPIRSNPLFYFYFFRSPDGRRVIEAIVEQGAGASGIRGSDLVNVQVPNPPKQIQDEVAGLLGSIDDRISLLRETNTTLEAIAQALFKSWFVDFDPVRAKMEGRIPEGMDEDTAALFPDSLEETELGAVPKGWKATRVAEVAEVVKGKSYSSKDLVETHHTALVTLKSFKRGGGFRMDGFKPYSGAYKPAQIVRAGDLILAYTDVTQAAELIGKPAIVVSVNEFQTLVASLDVGIIRPNEAVCGKQFLYGLFRTDAFQAHTLAHTSGTTVLHLAKDGVGSFVFPLPTTHLVHAFEEISSAVGERKQTNSDAIRTLSTLRDTLLPRLISGQLRLPEAIDQMEEALS
jgi:type I restriction enzyme, S subunit